MPVKYTCFKFVLWATLMIPHVVTGQGIEIYTYFDEAKSKPKEHYYIKDSISAQLNGPYESFYSSGNVASKGFYKTNIPDSLWQYYYENGHLKMEGLLKNGQNFGNWKYYFENGNLNMQGPIFGSTRQGTWEYYFENGILKSEGGYIDNKKNGIWNYYYEDGTHKAQAYYIKDAGWYKEFYHSGKLKAEGKNVESKSDSTWVFYYEDGNLQAEGNYNNGVRDGNWIFFYENGSKSAEGAYVNGTKDGKWTFFHENGNISSEGALQNNQKEGYWKIFNENGDFTAEGVFKNNDGQYTEYYESGKLKAQGNLKKGENDGQWFYYYEDGSLEGECLFDQGTGDYTGYYSDGTIKMKGKIEDGVNVGIWELYHDDGSLAGYYRPYYEDKEPAYKLVEKPAEPHGDYMKPAYRYKNSKIRYFDPVINEYRGIILATNPLPMFIGSLPISIEYYFQERLGYELQVRILRDPFFKKNSLVPVNESFERGFDVALRQKFYHPEGDYGMFYFAHEVRLTSINHLSNILDSTSTETTIQESIRIHETKFEYSVLIGDRFMTLYGERMSRSSIGITIDGFVGLGIGYRLTEKKYSQNPAYDQIFNDVNTSKISIAPRIGINIGIVF